VKSGIKKVLLLQPNYAVLGKRIWKMPPYNLALLYACIKDSYDTVLEDANFDGASAEELKRKLLDIKPDAVGITSFSTEYIEEIRWHARLVKDVLPEAVVVLGGVLPSVWAEKIVEDPAIDYCILGEGEYRLPALLAALNKGEMPGPELCGVAYRDGQPVVRAPAYYIEDLDQVPFPDYGNLDFLKYGRYVHKYSAQMIPRQYPFACTITSRGCPYKCVFCSAALQSGKKVRMRSSANVLNEIDAMVKTYGIREVIFMDDHFLHNLNRARDIMQGLLERSWGLTWKCYNLSVWSLTEDILRMMKDSGSYQMTLSIESGNQDVLKRLIKKPVDLVQARTMIRLAQSMGFEIITNFIVGMPGETWAQIRETMQYAEDIDVDVVNFHIATPLPKTALMKTFLEKGLLKSEDELSGYTIPAFEGRSDEEFSGQDLQILRAFEWDRINFKTREKQQKVAALYGLTMAELDHWRRETRKNLGATTRWKERFEEKI
jgi:radical SAM superfamily enzyme YgiQ (UPF0313 family)